MITRGAFGNLVNRYKAVLKKCRLINTFGSLAVASMLILGGAASAEGSIIEIINSDQTVTENVDINESSNKGVYAKGYTGSFSGSNLNVSLDSVTPSGSTEGLAAVRADSSANGSVINFGERGKTSAINIEMRDQAGGKDNTAVGVWAAGKNSEKGGVVNLSAEELRINVSSANGWVSGISAQNNTQGKSEESGLATVNINAGNTYIDVSAGDPDKASAIVAMSQGRVNIDGNLYVNTGAGSQGNAILTRGDSVIKINEDGGNTVQLNGDIAFDYHKGTSGTSVDSTVIINLTGADSYWNGNTKVSWDGSNNLPELSKLTVSNMTLNLSDGAVWTPTKGATGDPTLTNFGAAYTALNNLNMNKGVINLNPDVNVEVDNMTGSGTVNLAADIKEGEHVGTLTAGTAKDAALDVNITGVTSDDITAEQAKEIMSNVGSEDEELKLTGNVAEGLVNGALNIGSDGSVSMGRNHVMESALEIASITSVSLDRILNNDVRKRMGDLRSVSGDSGVWMRWDGGRLKGDSGLTNDFNTVQIGADTLTGWDSVRVGLAASFTYGDGDHKRGSSEMEGVALAAYGVWMADNGMFADVIARLGNFDTDVKLAGYKGSINSTVASLSGEFGWRFNLDRFYVEPQLELAYTYVDGDKFSLGSARYDVDDTDSLIGRAGVSAGWKLPGDRGDIYARASVVQQFLGDAKISGANNGMLNVYELDGQDTWFEYGVGTNLRLTEKASVWADVERTEGAKIDEEWRGTVGLRYMF